MRELFAPWWAMIRRIGVEGGVGYGGERGGGARQIWPGGLRAVRWLLDGDEKRATGNPSNPLKMFGCGGGI